MKKPPKGGRHRPPTLKFDLKMKLTTLFLITIAFGMYASDSHAQKTRITLDVENSTIAEVLDEIEKTTEFKFIYSVKNVDLKRKVSFKVEQLRIQNILKTLFSNTQTTYKIRGRQIVLTKAEPIYPKEADKRVIQSLQGKIKVTGQVLDNLGLPLPGVSIVEEGTINGVATDFDGNFEITVEDSATLVFTSIGFMKLELEASTAFMNVVLKENTSELDEVVVVAYGLSTKEAITGSVAKIKTADIEKRTISNLTSVIEGSTTGVLVNAPSGQPGSGQDIRIRGFGSFGSSNAPLFIVDGIPINGSLNTINPSDIESVTILKDAGSTALYGNKAANGVILVTTKKGKTQKGEFRVNLSTSIVSRGTPEYDRLGPEEFYETYWEARRNAIAVPGVASDAEVAAANAASSAGIFADLLHNPFNVPNDQIVGVDGRINPNARLQYPEDLDWEKAISRAGLRRNADVSFGKRSDNGGFFASLGYLDEEGYIKNTNFSRVTARVNADFQATPWLRTGINLTGIRSDGNQAQTASSGGTANPFRFSRSIGSIYPVHAHNQTTGAYILDGNGNRTESLIRGPGASNGRHIAFELLNDIDIDERNRLDGKVFFELKLAKGLKFTNNMSYEVQNFYNTRYRNPIIGDGNPNADASRDYIRIETDVYNQLLTYETSFNSKHNFDVLLGHESQNWTRTIFEGAAEAEIFQGNIELVNFSTPGIPESAVDELVDESYFGRLNYNFNNKYYLSGSVRTDGNSRFSRANRWGVFWSYGGSWSIDRENFISEVSWIDNLKLRASYGQLGNANLGASNRYAYQPLLALGNNNQLEPGVVVSSLGNENLVWEKSIHTDVALEFGFFNRLRGSVEYFNKVSEDLIFEVPLPLSAGGLDFANEHARLENIGELFNKGIEVSLSYDILKRNDYSWKMTVNASTITNEITKLPDGQETVLNGTKQLEVGRSLFEYFINDWYGVDPSDGSGLYVAEDPEAEDVRTIDGVAVTPFSNNAKQDYLGSVLPDVYGSINSNFRYKGFGFDFLLTYQIGGENLDNGYRDLIHTGTYGASLHTDLLNRWRQPGDITDQPRVDATLSTQWDNISDRFLVDASFLSLRQVSLSYDLSEDLLNNFGVSGAKLFVNGENIFNLNARKGFNQQQDFSGNTSNVFVPSRLITLGLNLTF